MVPGRLSRGASYALVLVLTVQLAVWGAFLVPLRVGGTAVPLGLLLALAPVPLCRAGGRLLGSRLGAAGPLVVWSVVAIGLATQRREGDLVVSGSLLGLAFLALGLLGGAVVVGAYRPDRARRPPGGTAAAG